MQVYRTVKSRQQILSLESGIHCMHYYCGSQSCELILQDIYLTSAICWFGTFNPKEFLAWSKVSDIFCSTCETCGTV